MKHKNANSRYSPRLSVTLDELVTVTAEYAQQHLDELLDRIIRENVVIRVLHNNGNVVLAPSWWYYLIWGRDTKKVISMLFEESRLLDSVDVLRVIVAATGYIPMTTPDSAREIIQTLKPLLEDHPHADRWGSLLNELAVYWNTNHSPKLIDAAFAGNRSVYLLFTDGRTRMMDMRKFIGHGLTADDLGSEEQFRDNLTFMTEKLVWLSGDGEKLVEFTSEDLLRESKPVEDEAADHLWDFPDLYQEYSQRGYFKWKNCETN